jgi:hypothetical protein
VWFGLFYAFKVTITPKTTPGETLTLKQKWAYKIAEIGFVLLVGVGIPLLTRLNT